MHQFLCDDNGQLSSTRLINLGIFALLLAGEVVSLIHTGKLANVEYLMAYGGGLYALNKGFTKKDPAAEPEAPTPQP